MYIRDNIFLISCAARTGSTYLVHLLRSHPDLFCHGEVFGGDKVGGLLGKYGSKAIENGEVIDKLTEIRDSAPELFLYKYVLDTQGYKSIGFKYKTDEAMLKRYSGITKIISEDKDLKVIFLLRKNILAQYISHQIVLKQTGITLAFNDSEIPNINRITLDLNECVSYIRDVIARQKKAEEIYNGHRSLYLFYEDIIENSSNVNIAHTDLQLFLGVSVTKLSSPTKKIVRERLDNIVTNYDEICAGLKKYGLGKYVHD